MSRVSDEDRPAGEMEEAHSDFPSGALEPLHLDDFLFGLLDLDQPPTLPTSPHPHRPACQTRQSRSPSLRRRKGRLIQRRVCVEKDVTPVP